MGALKAPFPYFGGKSAIADVVWQRLGNVGNYIEPFAGSLAVLLGRPHWRSGARITETVNDVDGMLSNFWRAMTIDPEGVAQHADWPVNECDLHARHAWLVGERERITERLMGDPDWCDVKAAGWWLWGCCSWIGSGWCSGRGPWVVHDGKLTHRDDALAGQGINRQLPHLGDAGRGINRQLPHLGNAGRGINRQLPHLGDAGRVWPHLRKIAERLRSVRVACGDWRRVLGGAARPMAGSVGVFLDPPYGEGALDYASGGNADRSIAADVWEWAIGAVSDSMRIIVAGYDDGRTVPDGWTVVEWTGPAGYQASAGHSDDRKRERLWCSPACLTPPTQLSLLG